MVIGERIKMARHAAGFSLRALAEKADISHTAISKYEKEDDVPSSDVLIRLAKALGVKVEYFFRPTKVVLQVAPSYRRRTRLPVKQQRAILGEVQDWLERYVAVESYFAEKSAFDLPDDFPARITSQEQVESVAERLRKHWDLGHDSIENLIEVLEDRGVKVGLVKGHDAFDALTFWIGDGIPVIAVKGDLPGDRQRFNLAHELGHIILDPVEGLNAEKAANRFAGAFLVPQEAARFELGQQRQTLDVFGLHLLKHKYGLSMQGWIFRAKDLGIITESAFVRHNKEFRQRGWHINEPGDPIEPEKAPSRMERLIMRALVENAISSSRAAELLGRPLDEFFKKVSKEHGGLPVGVRS